MSPFNRLSRKLLVALFLVVATPIHIWTYVKLFSDIEWIIQRTNLWDALGVMAYSMVYALLESIVVTLFFLLLGLIVPKGWENQKVLSQLSVLSLVFFFWGGVNKYFQLKGFNFLVGFLLGNDHPVRWMWLLFLLFVVMVAVSLLIPVIFIQRSQRFERIVSRGIASITVLAAVYLAVDVVSIAILIFRNI